MQGQFGQARFVDDLYNNTKTGGFFFEAGAFNGESLSNTLHFEVRRGWTGILVEANPEEYENLLGKNRKVKKRNKHSRHALHFESVCHMAWISCLVDVIRSSYPYVVIGVSKGRSWTVQV